ncbi:hypothetical protein PVAND_010095 [Polypedilum vanderplanki]|uniref:F-box domain-containing protein n=1 Tax=Polypedilum vanderplanki TaxID=319348 RepID=A0A9J6CFL8_POLVA|nr:hypothetical protein PVAND_010095 [Polypedilum vanderplanki]
MEVEGYFHYNNNPLDELPFEILELIFEYLDKDDLKSLLCISGRARSVIIASSISMRKLELNLADNWVQLVPFVKSYGDNVRSLVFEYCDFDSPEQFKELIKSMKNIETIKLHNIHINAENFNRKHRHFEIDFERAIKLDFDNSQAVGKLTDLYMQSLQVDEMRLDFSHFNVTQEFLRLLWSQHYLKTLELAGFENILYKSLFQYDISYMIYFHLNKLILNHRVTKHDSFFKFIKCLETLEELELLKEVESQEFLNLIFEMNIIKSLTLATNFVTLKNIDFKKLKNCKIEKLILITRHQYGVEQSINYFIEKLQNLKTLKVINLKPDSSDQLLAFVHIKTLENFYVENSKMKFLQNIKFDCLKSLKLSNIHPFLKFEDWENLFKNNQSLEHIEINDFEVYCVIEHVKLEIEKVIRNIHHVLKSLKYLKITQDLRYSKPIKVVMKVNENAKFLRVSDSFIKVCREDFHYLRKIHKDLVLQYYADEYFRLNNKYLNVSE